MSLKPRTLITTYGSFFEALCVTLCSLAILISKSLYILREVGGGWTENRGVSRGRPSRKLSGNRLSQRICVKRARGFFLPQPLSRQPRILLAPYAVFSFSTSSYFHVHTQRVSYETTNVGTLDCRRERGRERERFRSRREALCIGNLKSQPGNNSYVWIDSYYYKAYVGRACGTSRVCVPHRDRLAWLAVWPQLPSIFAISLSSPPLSLSLSRLYLTEEVHLSRLTVTNS